MTPICFIDTETDGVHPDRKVWEIAMIRRSDKGERYKEFFVEIDLSTADPFGLKVGGFYERHPLGRSIATGSGVEQYDQERVASTLSMTDAALAVARMTHGAHLVGAVPNFDAECLAALLRNERLIPSWHYHLVDVEAMAVGFLAHTTTLALPWKSDDLSRAIGVEPPSETARHTAMGDAEWAMRIYDRITAFATPGMSLK